MSMSESHMVFTFQRRYLYLELAIAFMVTVVSIIAWGPLILTKLTYNIILPSALRAAFLLTGTTVLCIAFIFFVLKEVRKFLIVITDERLIVKNPYRIRIMLFADMNSVEFIRFPLHHGFLKIKSDSDSITLPLYIENMEGLIQAIATGLVRYGSLDIFDKKTISELKIAAGVYSHAYHRGTNVLFPIIFASCAMFVFNCIVASTFWEIDFLYLIIWASTGIIVPPFTYVISDRILNSSLRKSLLHQVPSMNTRLLVTKVTLVVLLLYFVFGWIFKSII